MKMQLLDVDGETGAVVTLSRRNLLSLLHKLDMPGSHRTLSSRNCARNGQLADDLVLVLQAEDDIEHYASRGFAPGAVHPLTEAFVAASEGEHEAAPDIVQRLEARFLAAAHELTKEVAEARGLSYPEAREIASDLIETNYQLRTRPREEP